MSTAAPQTPAPQMPLDVSDTAPIPFLRQVKVEFRKSYDTRAGFWLLAAIGILVGLVEGFILIATLIQESPVLWSDFAYTAGGITSLLLPVLAILLVTSEWSQRSAMVSFSLEPRRSRVVYAKLAVSAAYALVTMAAMLLVGVVGAGICELVQPDLTEWDFDLKLAVAFLITQLLTMALGFAFGALLLNTPAAIVVFFIYWYIVPTVLFVVGSIRDWLGDLLEWFNFQAALGPVADWEVDTGEEWAKLIVSGIIWIGLPLAGGIYRILRAEVK